ncbi:MAG: hypothetical protein Q4D89_14520 [Arachnia propionica]|uniref:hypothetical protein n=1 Tax=Arachnia propionica TaxID=1750 RepID=UPI0026FDFA45|nr:hypothetical protein [Arachnia propionica]
MNRCEQLIEGTNWGALGEHAHGPATDLPELLGVLLSGDGEAAREAVHEIWEATMHQGRAFGSTPPVTRFLAHWIAGQGDEDWDEAGPYIALRHIHESGQAAREPEAEDSELAACAAEVLGELAPLALQPTHPADGIITAALLPWLGVLGSHRQAVSLRTRLDGALDGDATTREWRGLAVLGLGELGQDVSRFLDDPDPAIRTCAALTSSGAGATRVLQETAALGEAADEWFAWTVSFRFIHGVSNACELELRARQG